MIITTFTQNDLRKAGGFKKKNNCITYSENEFIDFVKKNKLILSKGYIDNIGYIDNEKMFKCNMENGLMIGVTSIINKIKEQVQE